MEKYVEHQVKGKVERFVKGAVKVIGILILIAMFILLFGYVFMWLWNWLMPDIFGLQAIGYWQAIGLLVLAKLIFGGFEGKGSGKKSKKSKTRCRSENRWETKKDAFKWEHYDAFWKEEGEQAYKEYVARRSDREEDTANGQ